MYMAETLQYPLFLTAFYLAMAWLATLNQRRAVLLGAVMGVMLLNKVQGIQFILPFFVAAAVFVRGRSRQIAIMLFLTFGPYLLWQIFKAVHAAPGFGAYGRALDSGLPHWTWSLAVSYAADFLLAPGLVLGVPLFLWMRANIYTQRTQVFFVAALFGTQLLLVSTLDGGLTGWLRERLFMYCFPITAVLATRGLGICPQVSGNGLFLPVFPSPLLVCCCFIRFRHRFRWKRPGLLRWALGFRNCVLPF
jgi:hypothetical protein